MTSEIDPEFAPIAQALLNLCSLVPAFFTDYAEQADEQSQFLTDLRTYPRPGVIHKLHLPLDGIIFESFARITNSPAITKINNRIAGKTAYMLTFDDYKFVELTLCDFIAELNRRSEVQFQVTSRIELNYLWL